ncbi:MAG: lipoyl(octanoyl) transferase LipB [Gemmatimonadota bacterium]|nr:lipoyl(octanoyl) transferase LipB [Gemmatimonadota bacterium]
MTRTIYAVPVFGLVPYHAGLAWQRELARDRMEGRSDADLLLLLEHEPVVTLGRGAREANLVASPELLAAAGVTTAEVERGGDVTYHGPGQLVGYPILDLSGWRRDLHWYLRQVEEALITALGELGLEGFRVPGYTGVWVGDPAGAGSEAERAAGRARKIASIGVHVSRWVTWHGFALNVTREPLERFSLIVPCGIPSVRMTSLAAEGRTSDAGAVYEAVRTGFARAFEAEVPLADPVRVGETPRIEAGAA